MHVLYLIICSWHLICIVCIAHNRTTTTTTNESPRRNKRRTTWHFATLPNNTVGQQNNIIKNLFKILFAATIVPRCISYWVAWRATLSGRTYRRTMRSSVSTTHSPRSFCSPAVWSLRPLSMLASRSVALWMEYPLMWSTPSAGSTVRSPCRMRSIDR